MKNLISCVGYFDSPDQDEPAFDPRETGLCPVCDAPLKDTEMMSVSALPEGGRRCYIIAYHKACASGWNEELEAAIMDEVFAWDDEMKRAVQ